MASPAVTKLGTYVDPEIGDRYVTTEDGEAWVTKDGQFYSAAPGSLNQTFAELGEGARPATADEVRGRLRQKESDNLAGGVATVVQNVATGALNAAASGARGVAILAGEGDAAKTLTGESFLKDLAGLKALKSGGDITDAAKASEEWSSTLQARRSLRPTLSTASQLVGEVGLVAASGGLAAAPGAIASRSLPQAMLRAGAAAGAENAILSTSQEAGAAVLENRAIDRERLAADGFSAAILGAALGGGAAALGRGVRVAKDRLLPGAIMDDAGRASRESLGIPLAAEEQLAATTRQAADAVEAAGVNPIARAQAAEAEARLIGKKASETDPSNWRELVRDADPNALYIHREAVLDGATRDASDDLNKVLENQRAIENEIDNFSTKREKVAEHLAADGVDETELLGRAQADVGALRARIEEARATVENNRLANAEPERAAGAANDSQGAPTRKKAKRGDADVALNRASFIVSEAERALAKAESGADGVIAIDSMRRELSKSARQTRAQARQTRSLEERVLLEPVRDLLEAEYDRAALSLMDESFVGKTQAVAQSSVNNARVGSIDADRFDLRSFTVQVGSEDGARYGGQVYGANRDAIRSLLADLQPGEATRLKTEQFERFLEKQEKFLSAARENYSFSSANAKRLDASIAANARLRSTLDVSREAAGKVNQAKALISADQVGGGRIVQMAAGAFFGGVEGGAGGALRGLARGALGGTEQVISMRGRYAALAETTDRRVAHSMVSWLDRLISPSKGASKKGGRKKLVSDEMRAAFSRGLPEERTILGGALGASPALRRFISASGESRAEKREILRERRQVLAEIISNPERIERAAAAVLGQSAHYMPGMAADMVAETVQRLTRLHDKLGGSSEPSLLPGVQRTEMVSDQELRAQDALVQATLDPMSVFADFERGSVDPIKADFVREMYPEIWAQAQAATIDALSRVQKMPSQQALSQMDQFLGFNGALDPSLRPEFLQRQVERSKLADAQDKPPAAQRPPKFAQAYATTSQRLAAT